MKSLAEILKLSTEFLVKKQIDRPHRVSEDLLAHVLKLKRMDLYLQFDRSVNDCELDLMGSYLRRAAAHEPIEYIIGEIRVYDCRIKVDSRALIPRTETEILIDLVAKRVNGGVLWDLCTGTGCIGIALKKKHPKLEVTLADISKEALSLAKENIELNEVEVEMACGDLLEPFFHRKADIVVCNPPYVSKQEYEMLHPSVRCFEPKLALVAGEEGTEYFKRLQKELGAYLNPGAQIFFEIGASQEARVKELFSKGEILPDWADHPRFFMGSF